MAFWVLKNRKILITRHSLQNRGSCCKVIFFSKNISTSRLSRLIINPKLSTVTLKFAHIWNQDWQSHATAGLMTVITIKILFQYLQDIWKLSIIYTHTRATEKQNTGETQAIIYSFSLALRNYSETTSHQVFFKVYGFDLGFKFLRGETSLLCFE